MNKNTFIEFVADIAIKDWKKRRIMLPSVVIAQACKESSFGTSELAVNANAIFGIKLNGWTGDTYIKKADEQNTDGSFRVDENCLWRKYKSWEESIIDHNTYIAERKVGKQSEPNFKSVIGEVNVKKVLAGLVGSKGRFETANRCTDKELKQYVLEGRSTYSYATDLEYPQSLLDDYIIKYNLTKYDDIEEEVKEVSSNIKVVALDAGHGLKTAGKQTPDGIKEWTLNDKVRDKVVTMLTGYNVRFVFPDMNEGNVDESITNRRIMYVNEDVDAAVSIHHNAFMGFWGSATGVEVYTDKNPTVEDTRLANLIYGRLPVYTGLKGRGVKKANFTVINQNSIPAVLVEGGFMDNKKDYAVITSEVGQNGYARAIAEALIDFLDLELVNNQPSKTEPVEKSNVLYKVQCGAFSKKENAQNLVEKLKKDGYSAIIVEVKK